MTDDSNYANQIYKIFTSKSFLKRCANISVPKKGNLERHFTIMHNKYTEDFPVQRELRKKSLRN